MINNNIVADKSEDFALQIIFLYKDLSDNKKEFVLSKQILRSGTSIGANIAESKRAQSRADFYSKLNISLKEAEETVYWLRLLNKSEYIDNAEYESLVKQCDEIIRILVATLKHSEQ